MGEEGAARGEVDARIQRAGGLTRCEVSLVILTGRLRSLSRQERRFEAFHDDLADALGSHAHARRASDSRSMDMETFLRWASPHPRRPDRVFDASFRPNTPPDAASETDDPRPRLPLPRRPRRSDLGLREYYPRFAAQGVETADDFPRERALDDLLETVGMDCNPGCVDPETCRLSSPHENACAHPLTVPPPDPGHFRLPFPPRIISHARKLKDALLARGGGGETRPVRPPSGGLPSGRAKKKKRKADAALAAADPAEAIRAAMAAARARGGGGETRPVRPPTTTTTTTPSVSAANRLDVASAAELETIVDNHRRGDELALLGLPPAPVDLHGKVDWSTHPVSRMGEVAMRAKVMALRADPVRCRHPLAADAVAAVDAAVAALTDRDARKDVLTRAVRRRVEEMRRDGVGDVAGGYVSSTGVHYAAGAAASETANHAPDGDAHGPATKPGATNARTTKKEGVEVGFDSGEGTGVGFGSGGEGTPKEAAKEATKEAAKEAGDAAREARTKLAKRRGPSFM